MISQEPKGHLQARLSGLNMVAMAFAILKLVLPCSYTANNPY